MNHTQNKVGKLFKDFFIKNLNWPYRKVTQVVFVVYRSGGLRNYIKTKMLTFCFALI